MAKITKAKADTMSGGGGGVGIVKVSGDMKTIQNNNKLNNNAIDVEPDDGHVVDKIDLKAMKSKNAMAPAPAPIAMATMKPTIDIGKAAPQKPNNSGLSSSDVANKSNNNNVTTTATTPKNPAKDSTKKKSKEKDQKVAEEKRRQQEEDEERKRLELIAAQRKAKLVDQNAVRAEQGPKRNNLAASVGKFVSRFRSKMAFRNAFSTTWPISFIQLHGRI